MFDTPHFRTVPETTRRKYFHVFDDYKNQEILMAIVTDEENEDGAPYKVQLTTKVFGSSTVELTLALSFKDRENPFAVFDNAIDMVKHNLSPSLLENLIRQVKWMESLMEGKKDASKL